MRLSFETILKVLVLFKCASSTLSNESVHQKNNLEEDVNVLKDTTKTLSGHLEKWNNLFLNSLEPRMSLAATSLANIDSNVNNLQERAHVWDTFQLHVSAWNEQLATLDRKADIISRGQEKLLVLETNINAIANMDYRINESIKKSEQIEETLFNLRDEIRNQYNHRDRDVLFGEFATRGILSSIKMIENKLDRLLLSQKNNLFRDKGTDERPRLTIKCNTPHFVDELLHDISSKVDIIFDKVNGKEENDNNSLEDYLDEGSGSADLKSEYDHKITKRGLYLSAHKSHSHNSCDKITESIDDLLGRTYRIEDISSTILETENHILENLQTLNKKFSYLTPRQVVQGVNNTSTSGVNHNVEVAIELSQSSGCENLNNSFVDGVYIFGNVSEFNSKNRTYNKKYCLVRDDGLWTVLQRRDDYSSLENFNLSWSDYKHGFGTLDKDFWFGNDFISKLSNENNLTLRIEMEDFNGEYVWAEYTKFVVLPGNKSYQLIVGGYRGNASDSFSSHNGSLFSTFDKKNDQAPECCPCAVSYGGGWWFNSCFESNLNGPYIRKGNYNGYYGGLIWETWLGNYSLKKTTIMAKVLWSYYEDP